MPPLARSSGATRRATPHPRPPSSARFSPPAVHSRATCDLAEATYFAGLRMAGMPDEEISLSAYGPDKTVERQDCIYNGWAASAGSACLTPRTRHSNRDWGRPSWGGGVVGSTALL